MVGLRLGIWGRGPQPPEAIGGFLVKPQRPKILQFFCDNNLILC